MAPERPKGAVSVLGGGEAAGDDTRAKDLAPDELAELASWFTLPSFQLVEEQQAREAEESSEERDWRETRERRDKAAAAADPAFLAYIRRHEDRPPPFEPLPPVELTIREDIVLSVVRRELDRLDAVDPLVQSDERPYGVPPDVKDAVDNHNAPQAILRDLYRPVPAFDARFESPFDELPITDPHAIVRAALQTRLEVPWTAPPMSALDETRRDFRAFLGDDWAALGAAAKAWHDGAGAEGS